MASLPQLVRYIYPQRPTPEPEDVRNRPHDKRHKYVCEAARLEDNRRKATAYQRQRRARVAMTQRAWDMEEEALAQAWRDGHDYEEEPHRKRLKGRGPRLPGLYAKLNDIGVRDSEQSDNDADCAMGGHGSEVDGCSSDQPPAEVDVQTDDLPASALVDHVELSLNVPADETYIVWTRDTRVQMPLISLYSHVTSQFTDGRNNPSLEELCIIPQSAINNLATSTKTSHRQEWTIGRLEAELYTSQSKIRQLEEENVALRRVAYDHENNCRPRDLSPVVATDGIHRQSSTGMSMNSRATTVPTVGPSSGDRYQEQWPEDSQRVIRGRRTSSNADESTMIDPALRELDGGKVLISRQTGYDDAGPVYTYEYA